MNSKLLALSITFLFASLGLFAKPIDKGLTLLDFSVTQNGTKTDIKWSINSEPLGEYFTVEKSQNGKDFIKVIDMSAGSNGSQFGEYFETDYQPFVGVSYYRIKQIDRDGIEYYSDLVTVKYVEEQNQLSHHDLPVNRPTRTEITEGNEMVFVLRDMDGNDFYSKTTVAKEDNYMFAMSTTPSVPSGIYHIVGSTNDKFYRSKLIVK